MKSHSQIIPNVEKSSSYLKWVMLLHFAFTQITNILMYSGVSPIWSFVALYFKTNDYDMNWLTNWYYFGPMIFAFFLNPLTLYNYGISQITSCTFTAIGYWILYFSFHSFTLGMLGFIFLALGNSIIYQIPLQLSKLWFEPQERIVSTFLGQYANNTGILIGYLVSATYFYEVVIEEEEFNLMFKKLILFYSILSSICCLLSPVTLIPSRNVHDGVAIRDTIWDSLIKALRTGESLLDLFTFSSYLGISWCYTMLIAIQQASIGQTNLQIIMGNASFQVGGIVAAIICTYQLNKESQKGLQQNYDKFIKRTISLGFASLVIEILFLEQLPTNLTILLNLIIGAGLGGTFSIQLESLMEKHHPIQELAIGSLLSGIACTIAFIVTMILAVPQFSNYSFQISSYFLIPSFCYIFVFYQTKYRRFEFES